MHIKDRVPQCCDSRDTHRVVSCSCAQPGAVNSSNGRPFGSSQEPWTRLPSCVLASGHVDLEFSRFLAADPDSWAPGD